ncbi:MAG TPA: ketoacyl-ACP synthase III [Proteobacteria bacterium]|nr:3-oxoacyl-[acyl-carrier-protein] synthase 3 [bacterium BMS3Abin14]HDL53899.1 ketoacyl-ACP synthase III [Pseudomonadota bacterium]
MRSFMAGTGSYLPERKLTNAELTRMVDTSDEWIISRTGIRERRIAAPDQASSDLATAAAKNALEAAGIEAGDLDLIIVATLSPDHMFPSTAGLVQRNLKAVKAAAFDLEAACTGFIYALTVGDQFIKTGKYSRILVIAAEVLSRFINYEDRNTCVLFGDGAGAVVLVPSEDGKRGIISTHLYNDGSMADLLIAPAGGSRMPVDEEAIAKRLNTVKMNGNEVFRIAVRKLSEVVDEVLEVNGLKEEDIDFLVPHQANLRIIMATAKKLKLPLEKVVITVDRHGNTSAASVPLALDEAVRSGRINPGDLVLLEAFGGGLTWGAALVRW